MSADSYLKSYTHDGGSKSANSSLKARELGLLERLDALLAATHPAGQAQGFIDRVNGQATPLRLGMPTAEAAVLSGCSTCAVDLTPNDESLVELDQRINGLWPSKGHTHEEGHSCPGH